MDSGTPNLPSPPNSARRISGRSIARISRMIQNASTAAARRDAATSELTEAAIRESELRAREVAQAAQRLRTEVFLAATESAIRGSQRVNRMDEARSLLGLMFGRIHGHRRLGTLSALTNVDDRYVQDEKRQIRMQIEATSTTKLAPKLNETELIQSLVCSERLETAWLDTAN